MSTSKSFKSQQLVNDYLNRGDWRVSENANTGFSLQGLNQYISTSVVADYWLNNVYGDDVRKCVDENRFHIHDLGFLSSYCSGWSIEDILLQGFGGVENKLQCRAPKHFNTALNQIVNFLFAAQGELAGAQALSNVDTYMAPFIRSDELTYEQVFKYLQSFVYSLNVPTRAGFQAPFTNISLDLVCPKSLAEHSVIIGGRHHPTWGYDEFQVEMDMFNKALCSVMTQGDGAGAIFSFPIPTYTIADDFDWSSDRFNHVWDMTAKYGIGYFANFVNSDLNPADFRSMCCRLRLDTRKIQKRNGGLFGSTPLTGSLGVVTLNLPNLAMRSTSIPQFFTEIQQTLLVAKTSLETKRDIIESHMGLYPYARHYLSSVYKRTGKYWSNHFNTIGIIGMHDACNVLFKRGILHNKDFAVSVMKFIKDVLNEFQQETGNLYNLEATPAESTCYKLANKDRQLFPDREIPEFYTNSTMLPVSATDDIFKALEHQESLQMEYTGGTVFHSFLGERLQSGDQARDLVKAILTTFKIPYLTLTPSFSLCKIHGYINGEHKECPQCGKQTLIYSRIVGYFRPVQDWNTGKQLEFDMRKTYDAEAALKKSPMEFDKRQTHRRHGANTTAIQHRGIQQVDIHGLPE